MIIMCISIPISRNIYHRHTRLYTYWLLYYILSLHVDTHITYTDTLHITLDRVIRFQPVRLCDVTRQ